jgi:cyclophilin family peptidyl-prolyl cis-trans isomerase
MNKYFTYGAIIIVLIIGFFMLRSSFSKDKNQEQNQNQTLTTNTLANQTTMKATLTTNKGIIEIELLTELAPNTVQNFAELSQNNFYDGVKFHRVIDGFMIQSGDPLSKDNTMMDYWGTGGPGYSFEDEIHAENHNIVGTISMANAGPNTNGSQFFINTADNSFLDTKHTVFGKVISGMDVVKEIEKVATYPNDRPVEDVVIERIDIN